MTDIASPPPTRTLAHMLTKSRGKVRSALAIARQRKGEKSAEYAHGRRSVRIFLVSVVLVLLFCVIAVKMMQLAISQPQAPVLDRASLPHTNLRADIVDRRGRILASNMPTYSLYVHPAEVRDAHPAEVLQLEETAQQLADIFPDLSAEALLQKFQSNRKFAWVRRKISSKQKQKVHDIGVPGLYFGPRDLRIFPNGAVAAHVLGGVSFGAESTLGAEVIGIAGVEKYLEKTLRDPTRAGSPVQLSIDLSAQAVIEQVLQAGMQQFTANAAAAVLMDVHTGEVIALASLPDFDPNDRPTANPDPQEEPSANPLFNHAVQASYELGSVFKLFTIAQALELGLYEPDSIIDTSGPMRVGGKLIREFENRNYGEIPLSDVIVFSSNRGSARIGLEIGAERQRAFLGKLGFLRSSEVELLEAGVARPLFPDQWSEANVATISYGHGIAVSPLQLATGYASILNGGTIVTPTLLKRETPQAGERIVSLQTSRAVAKMLRGVVVEGTASFADISGYAIGGKTGTANKVLSSGRGYYEDKVIATFASVFPAEAPQFILITLFDEPTETSGDQPRRSAGWTAVPVGAEIIRRVAPILDIGSDAADGMNARQLMPVSQAKN